MDQNPIAGQQKSQSVSWLGSSKPNETNCSVLVNCRNPILSQGFPFPFFRQTDRDEANVQQVWFPCGLPRGSSVCVASSRLGRTLEDWDRWFDALRTLAAKLDPQKHFFLTASGTTTDRYIRHVAQRFGFDVLEVCDWTDRITDDVDEGFKIPMLTIVQPELASSDEFAKNKPQSYAGYLLPTSRAREFTDPASKPEQAIQACENRDFDRLLMQVAVDAYVLSVRANGKIFSATMERVSTSRELPNQTANTWLLIAPELTKLKVQQQLISAGAIGWWLYEELAPTADNPAVESDTAGHSASVVVASPSLTDSNDNRSSTMLQAQPILSIDEFPAEKFLIHWTRACFGPWPDQTEEEYLDDLLFQSERRRHGERFALRRILATKRIFASHRLTRDSIPVVCFSNRRLTELPDLTVFRRHLGRWDFVPFGIAVNRDWMQQQGGRPVIYGDESTWATLSEQDRPFFQLARSKTGNVDWTSEQEWRWLGDLQLSQLPLQSVAVFVATESDAELIASLSCWPVVVLKLKRVVSCGLRVAGCG